MNRRMVTRAVATVAWVLSGLLMLTLLAGVAQSQTAERPPIVVNGAIERSLTGVPGDATRGREIVLDRETGDCVLCHAVPDKPANIVTGNVGPPLAGAGARLSAGQLRLRLVDSTRINPDSAMPAYHRVDGLTQVASQYRGKPVLTAQQVEDVIAYLQSLR